MSEFIIYSFSSIIFMFGIMLAFLLTIPVVIVNEEVGAKAMKWIIPIFVISLVNCLVVFFVVNI